MRYAPLIVAVVSLAVSIGSLLILLVEQRKWRADGNSATRKIGQLRIELKEDIQRVADDVRRGRANPVVFPPSVSRVREVAKSDPVVDQPAIRSSAEQPGETHNSSGSTSDDGYADVETNDRENVPVEEYSLGLVKRLYREWCINQGKPLLPSNLDVSMMEYSRNETSNVSGAPSVHILKETNKSAEFVRFSAAGSDVGVVMPNPLAHFSPLVAHLFGGLTRSAYENSGSGLVELSPVSIARHANSEWKVV